MELCKGKIMVNVDKGYDYFDDLKLIASRYASHLKLVEQYGL